MNKYDIIKLTKDLRLTNSLTGKVCMVKKGSVGVILEIYRERLYEIEFSHLLDSTGQEIVATVQKDYLERKNFHKCQYKIL